MEQLTPFGFTKMSGLGLLISPISSQLFHGDLRLVMAAYNTGENRVSPQLLSYSNRNVYLYVSRVAHVYRAELRRGGRP